MKGKTSENSQLVDQLANTAHEMVDRMHERAVKIEADLGQQSKETSEQVMSGIERQVSFLESFIAENPAAAAAIAFGIGAFGTQVFKSLDLKPSAAGPVESASSEETPEVSVEKAA